MIKLKLKKEEFEYLRLVLKFWEVDPNQSEVAQKKDIRILTQIQDRLRQAISKAEGGA